MIFLILKYLPISVKPPPDLQFCAILEMILGFCESEPYTKEDSIYRQVERTLKKMAQPFACNRIDNRTDSI